MQLVRHITTVLVKVLALLLLLVIALYGSIVVASNFTDGREFLGETISSLLPDVIIDQPGISVFGNISAKGIYVSDTNGRWLEVHDAAALWSPLALFTGRVNIHEVLAQQVSLIRLPEASEEPDLVSPSDEAAGLSLPFSSLDLAKLNIKDVSIPAAIAGTPAQFSIVAGASFVTSPVKISGNFKVVHRGKTQGSAEAKFEFSPQDNLLNYQAMVSEAANGLVVNLLKIPDTPRFELRLVGSGPLSKWSSVLEVDLNSIRAIDGEVSLTQDGMQKAVTTKLSGHLSQFLPVSVSSLFAGQAMWHSTASLNKDYIPLSASGKLTTEAIAAELESKYSPDDNGLSAKAELKTTQNTPLVFTSNDQVIRLGSLNASAFASGPLENLSWAFSAKAAQLKTYEGDLDDLSITSKGDGAHISSQMVSIPLNARVEANGIHLPSSLQKQTIKHITATLEGTALPKQSELKLQTLHIESEGAAAQFDLVELSPPMGTLEGTLKVSDLGVFSPLLKQNISGSLEAGLQVLADFESKSGSVDVNGTSNQVVLQNEILDRILRSQSRFSTKLSATLNSNDVFASSGELKELSFESSFGRIQAQGELQNGQVDGTLSAQLRKLDLINPRVTGAIDLQANASGAALSPDIELLVQSDRINMDHVPLENLSLTASAKLSKTSPSGQIDLQGRFKGKNVIGKFKMASEDGKFSIPTLDFELGGNKLTGSAHAADIALLPQGLAGNVTIDANDLSTLSPMALTQMEGRATGDIEISQKNGNTKVEFDLNGEKLQFAKSSIGSIAAKGWLDTPFTRPSADANIKIEDVNVGEIKIRELTLTAASASNASGSTSATDFSINSTFAQNNDYLRSNGAVNLVPDGLQITLKTLQGQYEGIPTKLKQPTTISLLDDKRSVTPFELELGGGSLVVSGSNKGQLDINTQMKQLPLSLANVFMPSLALDGTLNGKAQVFGKIDAPQANWQVTLANFSAQPLKANSILPLQIGNSGSLTNNEIKQKTTITNGAGLDFSSSGTIGVKGSQSLSMTASGNIPLDVVGAKLITQDLGGSGGFRLSGSIDGNLTDPKVSIEIQPNNLQTTQFSTGMTLTDYTGSMQITADEVRINGLTAKFSNGGTLKVDGKLGLGADLPAQMDLVIDGGRYVDGTFVSALINANLSLKGPLGSISSPASIDGKVVIEQADVEIPSSFNSSINPVIVRHLNAPKPILTQAKELARDEGRKKPRKSKQKSPLEEIRLNVNVEAPGKIYIRGRGVNAEAGGSLNIGGTVTKVQTVGAFSLVRGRMDILSKRLIFNRGNVTFSGALVPTLDFAATTTASSTEVTVLVTGPADLPVIDFTSSPSLPKDEIIAQLLFGESVNNLSPVELARLASATATLTGGTSTDGPLDTLRNLLGVSDIDLNFDAEGNPEVTVGGYVSERVYLGVIQEPTTGDNAATVDIDVTNYLKLRGEAGSNGDAKAGFYYEREYD
ncbi:Translocation and assembly module TamB [Pseudovibrio axinellae]|uniref:Translocation and assembly module TamB n=1 Tax=Pseudovibrio axinellae TaxID=989403 RepID=A0A161X969_9HYPH|nr:translocation/assembly module TamB domain-containing protein [Pseudovibrio axinellae]KZL08475.1 Translocation and assembly module TamB [Pseudovibrio axinellae]SEP75280.1 autotransporter secretion inner membrane protein TamB [Pseudovibrio axinellae]